MGGTNFLEIEHKFLVAPDFDLDSFSASCLALEPNHHKSLRVQDTYYVLKGRTDVVLRHRLDAEIQQLTLKTRGVDVEVRGEVNLALSLHEDQSPAIHSFLSHLGIEAEYGIVKDIAVFEFADCEVVHYKASYNDSVVHCVEFEAVGAETVPEALAILTRYEAVLGFADAMRSSASLLDLLIPDNPIA